jgi:hypothetical protein
MNSEIELVSADEFVRFADSCPEVWLSIAGIKFDHPIWGRGKFIEAEPRSEYVALITLKTEDDAKPFQTNSDALASEPRTKVEVPASLQAGLSSWREQRAKEAEALAALRRQEQLEAVQRKKVAADQLEDAKTSIQDPRRPGFQSFSIADSDHERLAREERATYARALVRRAGWLKQWAERIQSGGAGLEPVWSIGNFARDHLVQHGIEHLWHFTDVQNLGAIFREGGLFSSSGLEALGISDRRLVSGEFSRSRDEQLGRERYVRLSFIPNSWFFHRVRRLGLIWLRFSPKVLTLGEVSYSFGNAASGAVALNPDLRRLSIDWNAVNSFSGKYREDRGPIAYPSHYLREGEDSFSFHLEKTSWNSEVLIKHFLPLVFCDGIFDCHTGERIEYK